MEEEEIKEILPDWCRMLINRLSPLPRACECVFNLAMDNIFIPYTLKSVEECRIKYLASMQELDFEPCVVVVVGICHLCTECNWAGCDNKAMKGNTQGH